MNKNRVVVHLMGHDYTMVTDQSPEKVQRLSRYVDRRMRELAILTRAGENMLPVLTPTRRRCKFRSFYERSEGSSFYSLQSSFRCCH